MIETRFKDTEVGRIPEDWEVKALGDVLSVGNGRDYKHLSFGDIPVYGTGGYMTSVSDYIHDGETVCIGRKGTIDEPQYHTGKIWTVDTLFYTYGFQNVCVKYLFYLFNRIDWKKYNEATGVPSLTSKNILAIIAQFPKLSEQIRIATTLSNIDALISELGKLIEKKRAIKQGAMQQLLTGKKRLKGFTDPWVEKKIKELFRITRGYVLNTSHINDRPSSTTPYPVYSSQTANKGVLGYYGDFLYENAITWTTDGANAGDVHFRKGKFYCTNVCGVLISEDGLANECIAGILSLCSKHHVSYVGNPKLMNNVMAEITILVPTSLKEQIAIAALLSAMDEEISALEAKRDKYIAIKQGMMQQLLSGKIRLID